MLLIFAPFRGHHFLIHSTISWAMSAADLSLTILVSRSCLGRVTLANVSPSLASFVGLAFCSAGMTVRILAIPICGLFFGSGRFPVAHPNNAGGPAHLDRSEE